MTSYPGQAILDNLRVGAVAFYDSAELREVFGFDLKQAGVVPIQLRLQNEGATSVTILEGSTVQDEAGLIWEILPSEVVYDRINKYTSGSLSGSDGVKRTALWGLAGAIVGAAAGIASGSNVGEAVGKGAAIGAAAGASSSVLGLGTTQDTSAEVQRDFSARSLNHNTIDPGVDTSGFLYFPSEMKRPKVLSLKFSRGSKVETLNINL
jgi:hypothetical protein